MGLGKWCQFAVMSALYMTIWLSCSIIAPFFPPEAIKKGANQMAAGLVFGAFAITSFLAGPLMARAVPRTGGKALFACGAGLCGCSNIIFGVLDRIQNGGIFVTSALVMRVMEALGSSATMVAAMAMIGGKYPEDAPQMLGLLEMFSGLAFMIGPVIGTLLFQIGGYELPFFCLGGLCLLLTALNVVVLPKRDPVKPKDESASNLLRIPAVWSIALALFISTAGLAVFNLGIAYHTQMVGLLSADNAGAVFFVQGGSYALSTPVFGWILNKLIKHFRVTTRVMVVLGCLLSSMSYLMIGPSPWLPFISSNLCTLFTTCVLIGLSLGVVCVPSIVDMVTTAEWHGLPEGQATYAMASGVFLSCFHLGSFLGSTLGGALIDRSGFEVATSVFAMLNLIGAASVAVTFAWEYRCGKGRRRPGYLCRPSMSEANEETVTPLVLADPDRGEEIRELAFYDL